MAGEVGFLLESCQLKRAIVLLSGGIDSATALYLTRQETDDIYSMNILYAQASVREAEASRNLASEAQVKEHITVSLPFFKEIQTRYCPTSSSRISSAYVPARNLIFYGIAAAYAEILTADTIIFGSNSDDTKELPDAAPQFIQLMNELIKKGTRMGAEGKANIIVNPLINYNKLDVLKLAIQLKVPLKLTWSCYEDVMIPCGKCRGCLTRLKAFDQLGVPDPLTYA